MNLAHALLPATLQQFARAALRQMAFWRDTTKERLAYFLSSFARHARSALSETGPTRIFDALGPSIFPMKAHPSEFFRPEVVNVLDIWRSRSSTSLAGFLTIYILYIRYERQCRLDAKRDS